jgi:exosortase A
VHADPQIQAQVIASSRAAAVSTPFVIIVCAVFTFAWYWETSFSVVSIWERSETFAHGFVVSPIVAYLIWRRRSELASVPVEPCLPVLAGFALAGLAWLLGEAGSVLVLSQFALVAMVPLAIWAVLGTRVAKALAFPLGFLFFAVPFGDFLVPRMIDWTADFTVFALRASGVPVYREGAYFQLPTGSWSVVEACSGIRYLIASLMVGTLYAYLTYASLRRRLIFIAFAVLVPIVANWVRAYTIVMLGHLSDNRIAVGVDHIIYGWIFFGIVIAVLFLIGSRWREDAASNPPAVPGIGQRSRGLRFDARSVAAALATLLLIAMWKPVYAALAPNGSRGAPQLLRVDGANGWRNLPESIARWQPHFVNPTGQRFEAFQKNGLRVGLYLGYYRDQVQGAELITWHNRLVGSDDREWRQAARGEREIRLDGSALRVRTGEIAGASRRLLVWQWYWVNGRVTSSDYLAKAYGAFDRLLARGDDAAVVMIYAPLSSSRDATAADTLSAFVADMAPSIESSLERARGR